MPQFDFPGLAFLLTAIGLFFFLIVRLMLKLAPRLRPGAPRAFTLAGDRLIPEHNDAVMVVETGGRIKSMNDRARQIFRLQAGEEPNLERLARKVRPSEALIKLCASEGQVNFILGGRMVEGTSYQYAANSHTTTVISLRYPEIASGFAKEPGAGTSAHALQAFTQLAQAIASSLDLEKTLQATLENIEKLIPADFIQVNLFDTENQAFLPYRLAGPTGMERGLEQSGEQWLPGQGFSGHIYRERKPLLLPVLQAQPDLKPLAEKYPLQVQSFLGVPLMVGREFIGTLELASSVPDTFRDEDLDLVQLLSGQAAIAIHNALLYHTEQQRTAELSGLARLAQAFGLARDQAGLYARLVDSIAPLLSVEILGFLVYDEAHRSLEARTPFRGLPDQIVAVYRARVQSGSPAERVLLDKTLLQTDNAAADQTWVQLGLESIARAASLRETVLVPLSTGGHILGYLHASNHTGGPQPFSQAELHLMMIIANQAASIIENATLVQQSRQRAQRAESLRRITNMVSSAAGLEEILSLATQELARVLRADAGAIFLLDQERGLLKLHPGSIYGSVSQVEERAAHLSVEDPQYHFTIANSQQILNAGSITRGDRPIVPFYKGILTQWEMESAIAVPLIAQDEGIGEIWFASQEADFFEQGDAQVLVTAAGQLAGAVEQSILRGQTDESLRRRIDQMVNISRISRELSASLDLNHLLNMVYDEALHTTGADCGTILLLNTESSGVEAAAVRFFVGDMPDPQLSALETLALKRDRPVCIANFNQSEYDAPHAGVLSSLVVPIAQNRRTIGLICLHGKSTSQFDDTAVELSQSLAVQAAVALQNALAYEDQARRSVLLKRELETLSRLTQVSRTLRPSQVLEESLMTIAQAIQAATSFQAVLISVYDAEIHALKRAAGTGFSAEVWDELRSHTQPWQKLQELLQPTFAVGKAFFIPEDRMPSILPDLHTVNLLPALDSRSSEAWNADDLLLVPMYDADQNPLGMISVDAPRDSRRPDMPTIDALEVFAAQAGMVIESHLRTSRLEHQMSELERERARLEYSISQAQQNLPVLLHKDMEQSIALRSLNQRIDRIRASLEIAALASRQNSEAEVLRMLGSEMLTRFAMQFALVAEKTPNGPRLFEVIGSFPQGANPEALFGQRNPLRQMFQDRQKATDSGLLLVSNLEVVPEWQNSTLLHVLEARSMVGMYLDTGTDREFGVLVVGQRALPAFLEEDRRVFMMLANQVNVSLQNLQLLNETRRRLREVDLVLNFSRQLGSLNPADILSALVENASQILPQIHAGWAGLWDEKQRAIIPRSSLGYQSPADILNIHYAAQSQAGEAGEAQPALPLLVYHSAQPERVKEVDFARQYHLSTDDLMRYRRATGGRLPVSVMVVPIIISETVLGVAFLENFNQPDAFSSDDEALISAFAYQAAMALENARLFDASERRAAQLQALTRVAGTITSSLQRDELISSLLDQLKLVMPYDTATLWLRSGDWLSVAAASGFSDNEHRLNLSVAVEDSALFKAMIATGESILVADLRTDTRFPSLLEPEYLSWFGIPLLYKSEVIGLIALEKREAGYYTREYVQAGAAFASQAAVSLENARLYAESTSRAAELDQRSQRMALLNRLSGELVASLDADHILQLTGEQLLDALHAAGVAALMIDSRHRCVLQFELPHPGHTMPLVLPTSRLFDHLTETQGIFQTDDAASERDLKPLWEAYLRERGVRGLLVIPLVSSAALQGWFLVFSPQSYRYSLPEIELARTMCNQTAIAVQNARLFAETRSLTEDLERRVQERTREFHREHQNSQTLLQITTELSSSLDMSLVFNRTLTVLNESVGCEESMIVLSQAGSSNYRAGIQLAVVGDAQSPRLSVERQIARWVVRSRQPLLIARIQEETRWEFPTDSELAYQSVVAVPVVLGEEVLGSLLLLHRAASFFSQDQIDLLEVTARQIGIALNNAELFLLIRDQSEHLGGMLREQQIEASRSRAILEAVADGVLVTDPRSRVTLFNASAERILTLRAGQVQGKSLDHFIGLFGKAGHEWMQTIRSWSENPSASPLLENYAEQLELDNGKIVSVHLAPVFWRQEFLGTVSTFRDITHEVQVDRLKSEFVANVSHELRTPMTSIKGYVEIMLLGAAGELTPQQAHFLQIVKGNTERLNVLVNDLLDVSRIESGRISLTMQPLDMYEIAEDVIADIKRRSREENKPMDVWLEADPGLPLAFGDLERIRQVLGNLVSNGYNYTPAGGCVTIYLRHTSDEVEVEVRDNGIGIAAEVRPRIFERFYRGEDPLVLATAGTGLGLAIAKTIIDMHHGRIWFESGGMRGEGSSFSFTLPI